MKLFFVLFVLTCTLDCSSNDHYELVALSDETIRVILTENSILKTDLYRIDRSSDGRSLFLFCTKGLSPHRSTELVIIKTGVVLIRHLSGVVHAVNDAGEPISWTLADTIYFGDRHEKKSLAPPRFAPGGQFYSLTKSNRASIFALNLSNWTLRLPPKFFPQRLFVSDDTCYIFGQRIEKERKSKLVTVAKIRSEEPLVEQTTLPFAGEVIDMCPNGKSIIVRSADDVFPRLFAFDLKLGKSRSLSNSGSYFFFLEKPLASYLGRLGSTDLKELRTPKETRE